MALKSVRPNGGARVVALVVALLASTAPAYAQLDPTLFLKRSIPNVLLMVDTGSRMQRDAPTDPTNAQATSNYYDPFIYSRNTNVTAENTLGVTALNTTAKYRRLYHNYTLTSTNNPKGNTSGIAVTTDLNTIVDPTGSPVNVTYTTFEAPTRLSIARAALYQAVTQNQNVARFGLYKLRQNSPAAATQGNTTPIVSALPGQSVTGTTEAGGGKWNISRPTIGNTNNGSVAAGSGGAVIVAADANNSNTSVLSTLAKDIRTSGGLIPAGADDATTVDEPVQHMLDDLRSEASRLITNSDTAGNGNNAVAQCRNTVAVLVVGGGEGTTSGADANSVAATAATFVSNLGGRRVPVYVIAIAPPAADVAQLQNIAAKSGGLYFEITKANIDAALGSTMWSASSTGAPTGTVVVPEAVRAINVAIQAAFETFDDLNTKSLYAAPTSSIPSIIPVSEFQVSSPIIGTVNLQGAKDANGNTLTPDPSTVKDRANNVIPQRSNVMLTTAFSLPSFDGKLRAFRVYKPIADSTQQTGWKFQSDGTQLWSANVPAAASRNLFTTLADGTMIAFTVANAAQLAPLMNLGTADATNVINVVRSQAIGTVLDSTPAVMNPPSLDPPPDDTYPAFAVANKDRRTIAFVGTNRGILEALDARTGLEVWGYIPMNLLPKLRTLWDGQAVGAVDFLMDGSPKISDVRLADGTWHTFMFIGQGAGGTFYQAIDVTLAGMGTSVSPTDDTQSTILAYFNSATRMPVKWSFPLLSDFDPTISTAQTPYGDLKTSASTLEKGVGQTWSDPAIGQVSGTASPYVVLVGSGFLPYSTQQQSNRGGTIAGNTFYIINAETGAVLDSKSVGSDGNAETLDNCAVSGDCTKMKNALQSDPVATGPNDSRFITKAYIGDLDGRIWRFDLTLNGSSQPIFVTGGTNPVKLYDDSLDQPIFSSMATVNVSGAQYVFAATGNDLLPANGVSEQYRLLGILDSGTTGTKTFEIDLNKVDNTAGDEKVTAFPAVAGDIVFFTTTTFNPAAPCTLPTASLYALTFVGGAAYDTNNDGKFNGSDSVLVTSIAGVRATAPFIVDQHLVFGAGGKVQLFGDPNDFNNGIGQAGVRILSWREVR